MKTYKKVELVAKNQIAGSYAAGCPSKGTGAGTCSSFLVSAGCKVCDRAQ